MSNVKTIILTGEKTEIDFEQNFMCFWVQNLAQINKLWLSGSGKVQIVGTCSVHCPFKMVSKEGGGGGIA